jgi:hypothetical protein
MRVVRKRLSKLAQQVGRRACRKEGRGEGATNWPSVVSQASLGHARRVLSVVVVESSFHCSNEGSDAPLRGRCDCAPTPSPADEDTRMAGNDADDSLSLR